MPKKKKPHPSKAKSAPSHPNTEMEAKYSHEIERKLQEVDTAMKHAVETGNVGKVKELLDSQHSLNLGEVRDPSGKLIGHLKGDARMNVSYYLHLAITNGHYEIAKLLFDQGSNKEDFMLLNTNFEAVFKLKEEEKSQFLFRLNVIHEVRVVLEPLIRKYGNRPRTLAAIKRVEKRMGVVFGQEARRLTKDGKLEFNYPVNNVGQYALPDEYDLNNKVKGILKRQMQGIASKALKSEHTILLGYEEVREIGKEVFEEIKGKEVLDEDLDAMLLKLVLKHHPVYKLAQAPLLRMSRLLPAGSTPVNEVHRAKRIPSERIKEIVNKALHDIAAPNNDTIDHIVSEIFKLRIFWLSHEEKELQFLNLLVQKEATQSLPKGHFLHCTIEDFKNVIPDIYNAYVKQPETDFLTLAYPMLAQHSQELKRLQEKMARDLHAVIDDCKRKIEEIITKTAPKIEGDMVAISQKATEIDKEILASNTFLEAKIISEEQEKRRVRKNKSGLNLLATIKQEIENIKTATVDMKSTLVSWAKELEKPIAPKVSLTIDDPNRKEQPDDPSTIIIEEEPNRKEQSDHPLTMSGSGAVFLQTAKEIFERFDEIVKKLERFEQSLNDLSEETKRRRKHEEAFQEKDKASKLAVIQSEKDRLVALEQEKLEHAKEQKACLEQAELDRKRKEEFLKKLATTKENKRLQIEMEHVKAAQQKSASTVKEGAPVVVEPISTVARMEAPKPRTLEQMTQLSKKVVIIDNLNEMCSVLEKVNYDPEKLKDRKISAEMLLVEQYALLFVAAQLMESIKKLDQSKKVIFPSDKAERFRDVLFHHNNDLIPPIDQKNLNETWALNMEIKKMILNIITFIKDEKQQEFCCGDWDLIQETLDSSLLDEIMKYPIVRGATTKILKHIETSESALKVIPDLKLEKETSLMELKPHALNYAYARLGVHASDLKTAAPVLYKLAVTGKEPRPYEDYIRRGNLLRHEPSSLAITPMYSSIKTAVGPGPGVEIATPHPQPKAPTGK